MLSKHEIQATTERALTRFIVDHINQGRREGKGE